jgi:hypothetical protein
MKRYITSTLPVFEINKNIMSTTSNISILLNKTERVWMCVLTLQLENQETDKAETWRERVHL